VRCLVLFSLAVTLAGNIVHPLDRVLFFLKLLSLLFEFLDDLLAIKSPFAKLLLNALVQTDVTLKLIDLLGHLGVFRNKLLGLLGLVVQLGGQLVVLKNGESRCGLQLFIVKRHQVSLGLPDFVIHFFA